MNFTGLDPFQIFLRIRKEFPKAFFLQTCSALEQTCKTTVIGLTADSVYRIRGGVAEVVQDGRTTQFAGCPLKRLQAELDLYRSQETPSIPYANGGAFGCLGYDVVREMEPRLKKFGYFSALMNSKQVEAEIHFTKDLLVFEHQTQTLHIILKGAFGVEGQREKILQILQSSPGLRHQTDTAENLSPARATASLGCEAYKKAVAKIKEHIRQGDIFQAVLAERFELEASSPAIEVFNSLRNISLAAYSFFFSFHESEFFGASPETLVKTKDGFIETHPIAGTRRRGKSLDEDNFLEQELLENAKEGAEHLMLVDLARNDVGRVAQPGTVSLRSFREVLRLPNVMHLLSKVDGKLALEFSELDALKACFPAGTLSGAPKIRAMEILSQLEEVPRGFYGGAVVAFDFCGGLDSCIAIRAMEVKDRKAILRAGAGIVTDSDPDSEYQEIADKLATLRRAMDLADARVKAAL